ncbi:MAG: SRPBCC domain-containing protein [Planctomycetota bacterium]
MSAESVKATVVRSFPASSERVFDTWLDSSKIGEWMFGPKVRDEELVRVSMDPRVGGTFSFVVRRQGMEIDHVGEYLELHRPRRLVFTWGTADSLPETSRVVIDIEPQDAGCELTLVHEMAPQWSAFVDRVREGWGTMLGGLERATK